MLHSLNELSNYHVAATDGDIGYCKDFLFNDEQWNLHYMLVDTHRWLPGGQKVLLSTNIITRIDRKKRVISIDRSRSDIERSPALPSNEPISRAYEKTYQCYFDYAYLKVGPNPLDSYFMGTHIENIKIVAAPKEPASEKNHEHSVHSVEDYDLQTSDSRHGHIVDFIVNEQDWRVVYLAVDVKHWLTKSDTVLLPPENLESLSWPKQKVFVALTAKQIENMPAYNLHTLEKMTL
ncbi:MAG: hypothetical protein ACFHVJ_02100 [Aestuariibacter sp.]